MTELSADHQRANRLHLTMLDMQDARRYLDAYTNLEALEKEVIADISSTVREALIVAAIVAYCRPFKYNTSPGQADAKLWIDGFWDVTAEQRALHHLITTKRDKFVAHADWEARSTKIVDLTETGVERTFSVPDLMEGLEPEKFQALALAVERDSYYQAISLQYRIYRERRQEGT
ncbi:hypothetical protein QPK32_25145 [Massilia sp. YIM B02763]|uniref:hypothetical protein n=1 Tax=Massilia sp. YIM B02763 TaxID=3050130 RepID=UPI0025B6C72D|nr:hypothetical protein [Massilia sp. YIM B02763]MDN4056358.1 hypothetical protein [Massilia sp. YIM B02763]